MSETNVIRVNFGRGPVQAPGLEAAPTMRSRIHEVRIGAAVNSLVVRRAIVGKHMIIPTGKGFYKEHERKILDGFSLDDQEEILDRVDAMLETKEEEPIPLNNVIDLRKE